MRHRIAPSVPLGARSGGADVNMKMLPIGNIVVYVSHTTACTRRWIGRTTLSQSELRPQNETHELRHVAPVAVAELNLSGLAGLQILDCSNNHLVGLKLDNCTSLQDSRSDGNPLASMPSMVVPKDRDE